MLICVPQISQALLALSKTACVHNKMVLCSYQVDCMRATCMQCLGVQQACLLASAVLNLINEFGL